MRTADTFTELYSQIKARKVPFFAVFFVTVLCTYALLYAVDFYPEEPQAEEATMVEEMVLEETVTEEIPETAEVSYPLPTKIIFDSLDGREIEVLNPVSREIADLDEALLSGVVRHPDSADFADEGNIFILGHSSYLPNVLNPNFQAFNGIQELVWGDRIRLHSEDTEYVYRVERVYAAEASDVIVPFTPGEARLTLATCDSFGSKDDRFIVEAILIGSGPLEEEEATNT
jgi:LPXTG-site transpeptidase (sortase) family protein